MKDEIVVGLLSIANFPGQWISAISEETLSCTYQYKLQGDRNVYLHVILILLKLTKTSV
jgi:hypothetical protein